MKELKDDFLNRNISIKSMRYQMITLEEMLAFLDTDKKSVRQAKEQLVRLHLTGPVVRGLRRPTDDCLKT